MSQYFIKKRKWGSFVSWVDDGKFYAECHLNSAVEVLTNYSGLSFKDALTLEQEKQNALKFLEEYNEFLSELNDVEKEVLNKIKSHVPLQGMSDDRFREIKQNLYLKWCRKYMPHEIVYIHEIDMDKFAKEIKQARLDKHYSRRHVAEFLLISDTTIRSYETGRRLPRLNILYALMELYEVKTDDFIQKTFK